jgi:putative sigma-54 modulation protein
MYASIDAVAEKLERQIRKYRTKLNNRRSQTVKGRRRSDPHDYEDGMT